MGMILNKIIYNFGPIIRTIEIDILLQMELSAALGSVDYLYAVQDFQLGKF